jgi:predicted permease
MLSEILSDVRFGARKLVRTPGFTIVAVVMLALGIGANAAVFSFIDAILLKTLPVADPGRLVMLGPGAMGIMGRSTVPQKEVFSYAQLEALSERHDVFTEVAASPTSMAYVTVGLPDAAGATARAACQLVSGRYFQMLGLIPFAGRWITAEDEARSGGNAVAVLSYAYWQNEFDGNRGALGETIILQGKPFQIIGVAPPAYRGHIIETPADFWVPLTSQPAITQRESMLTGPTRVGVYWLNIMARLAPNVTLEQAEDAVNAEIVRVHETVPDGDELVDFHVELTPAASGLSSLRQMLKQPLLLLNAGTALLLLIVCGNLANLLLARASDRRSEVGIRLALGAGRAKLIRELLSESVLLAAVGTALGIVVASWLMPLIRSLVGQMRGPNAIEVQLDYRLMAFAAAVGVGTIVLFGVAPALWSARSGAGLLVGARRTASATGGPIGAKNALVASQAAFSLLLLSCSGLLFQTLGELRSADVGFDAANVLFYELNPRRIGMPPDGQDDLRREILRRLEGNPYIAAASFAEDVPLSGNARSITTSVDGYESSPEENMNILQFTVSGGYFDTYAIPLLAGRTFEASDQYADVCIVSQEFADRFFAGRSPIGGVVHTGDETFRIIGVSGDVRQVSLRDDPPAMIYHPANGYNGYLERLVFETRGDAERAGQLVREAVVAVAPTMPIDNAPSPSQMMIDRSSKVEELLSTLTAVFAGLALLLAALGVYGLFSYAVRQRSGEFGVRQALGANHNDVVRLVMRQAGLVLASGALVGLAASLFATRILAGILYGVSPTDPWTFGISFAVLIAAGLVAAYAPARRAASVNPADLLRLD